VLGRCNDPSCWAAESRVLAEADFVATVSLLERARHHPNPKPPKAGPAKRMHGVVKLVLLIKRKLGVACWLPRLAAASAVRP
jgi:hypothetical protein